MQNGSSAAITMLGVLWFGIIVTFTGTDSSDANFKFVNSIRLGTDVVFSSSYPALRLT